MFDRDRAKGSFQTALRRLSGDPYLLAKLLRIQPVSPSKSSAGNESRESIQHDGVDWSGVLNAWIDANVAADAVSSQKRVLDFIRRSMRTKGRALESYDSQTTLHSAFNQVFASSVGNTLVPAMHSVCKSTHRAAVSADDEVDSRDHANLNKAATLLQESFSRTYNDRKEFRPDAPFDEEGSKKAGVLGIVNELFSIYFRLNTLRLCKNLVKPVEGRKLHLQGPMGQKVTYQYFRGRLNLFEDNWAAAEENLDYAFSNCHKDALHNKRCILRYLIPVKIRRGKLPTADLLQKYQLDEFILLTDGVRKGDLKTFNNALIDNQHRFIRQGTYLLLERCRTVCYRSLFQRIYKVTEKHQIPLEQVSTVFKWLDIPMDLDEIECILANLIYRGVIRGYLSHSKRVLVLSKRDPFPSAGLVGR